MAEAHVTATDLLVRAGEGDADAMESMFPLVYDELRRVANPIELRNNITGK